jgi:arylsulfatase A-like enzyme
MLQHIQRSVSLRLSIVFSCMVYGISPRIGVASEDNPMARPNVIVFLADDAGWGDYSQSGNKQVSTPNIDSIAQNGVSLERFFVCPVCSPTRAEFLTGRYHGRCGVKGVSTGQERLNLDERTIAEAFKTAGYATGIFGKWHNGSQWPYHPLARGFDDYLGYTSGHWGEYFDAPLDDNGKTIRSKGYIVDVCTDRAIAFLDRNRNQPFFCFVPFTTPHSPWGVPQEDWNRFKDKSLDQTATFVDRENVDHTRCALAMLENQDRNVGRVLNKLRELKLYENTILLYFSDNGPNTHRWTGGMKGTKGTTDEGGIRSVCYLQWQKKLPQGKKVERIAGAIDLLPTLTQLAQVQRVGEKPLDGKDLTPLLFHDDATWPDRALFTRWNKATSVRTDRFRLDATMQLFDMVNDPGQQNALGPEFETTKQSLLSALKQWTSDVYGANASSQQAGEQVDQRPIPVGYRVFPKTTLPARDGMPKGNVKRSSSAPNCSYFINWTKTEDKLIWKVDVQTTGIYIVEIDYTCPVEDAGSTIQMTLGSRELKGKVEPGWNPPLYTNQDTLPRPVAESQMKPFRTLLLGEVQLDAGQGELVLNAPQIAGKTVMDVSNVALTLKP